MLAWQSSKDPARPTGIAAVPELPWGAHFCHFYRTAEDLAEVLVPFFRSGLERNERCVWVTCEPLVSGEARARLRAVFPALDHLEAEGQIEIIDHAAWYVQNGALSAEAVLDGWRAREVAALRDGYDGLRVSGNTYFLERTAYPDFGAYEDQVHAAFRDLRILALCSYSLERCRTADLLDVLGHHGFALVRDGERWSVARSGSALLAGLGQRADGQSAASVRPQLALVKPPAGAPDAQGHAVRFYSGAQFPTDATSEYLAAGIVEGGAAIVIATAEHAPLVRAGLLARGVDTRACEAAGQLIVLDAEQTLAALEDGDELSHQRFLEVVGARVHAACERFGKVRTFGQLVDLLCQQNRQQEAIVLEQWWNSLRREHDLSVLCAYDVDSFVDASTCAHFANVCKEHGDVFAVSASIQTHDFDADRLLAHYEQQTRALQHELERARRLQHERQQLVLLERAAAAEAAVAGRYLARLQQITAALSEAGSIDAIAHVVRSELAHVVGASSTLLALARPGFSTLTPIGASGPLFGACQDAHRTGSALWIAAPDARVVEPVQAGSELPAPEMRAVVLPLTLRGHRLGALGLVFTSARAVGTSERTFIEDLARQLAAALDRA